VNTQDDELERLESRWRRIAGVVVVVAFGLAVVAVVVSWPRTTRQTIAVWDFVYGHHAALRLVVVVAVVVLVVVVVASLGESSPRTLLWGIPSVAVIALVLVSWRVAEEHSNAGDVNGRVRDVSAVLPPSAQQTTISEGENFRTEMFVVDGDIKAVSASIWGAARAQLGHSAGVWADPAGGDSPSYLAISFQGRNGCDGSVQVNVALSPAERGTSVLVSGSCED